MSVSNMNLRYLANIKIAQKVKHGARGSGALLPVFWEMQLRNGMQGNHKNRFKYREQTVE
ncbi:MAG: hypothetical protein J6T29_00645 [Alphaproteobacteria bacterium]|nr:hypothetical protein [Alphaproteobacteria bacterium]